MAGAIQLIFCRRMCSVRPWGRDAMKCHNKQLKTHRTDKLMDLLSHPILGLVVMYNWLPQYVVDAKNVSEFQKRLQKLVMEMASKNELGWQQLYSPRNTLWNNRLRKMQDWCPNAASRETGTALADKSDITPGSMRLFAFWISVPFKASVYI